MYLAKLSYVVYVLINILGASLIKLFDKNKVFTLYDILFLRNLAFFLILTPFAYKQNFIKYLNKSNIKYNIVITLFSTLGLYCWHLGIKYVPLNDAAIINLFLPVIIIIMSGLILKERIKAEFLLSFGICIISMLLLYDHRHNNSGIRKFNYGYIILFIDLFAYSFSNVLRKKMMLDKSSAINNIYFSYCIMLPISWILAPYAVCKINSQNFIYLILYLIIYSIGNISMYYSHFKSKMSKLQFIRFLKIPFAIIISFILLHESPNMKQIVATVIVLFVNIYLIYNRKKVS